MIILQHFFIQRVANYDVINSLMQTLQEWTHCPRQCSESLFENFDDSIKVFLSCQSHYCSRDGLDRAADITKETHRSHYFKDLRVRIALLDIVFLQLGQKYIERHLLLLLPWLVPSEFEAYIFQITQQYYEKPIKLRNKYRPYLSVGFIVNSLNRMGEEEKVKLSFMSWI